jgi:hypothetical protein
MSAPTPETRRTIVLLSASSVRAIGTLSAPARSIHVIWAAEPAECAKTKQLQIKLTSTATTEIVLLNAFHRSVNRVITPALPSGASRISHGTMPFI